MASWMEVAGTAVSDVERNEHPVASARVELREDADGAACMTLVGWLDRPALRRFERAVDSLSAAGVRRLTVECDRLRHVDYVLIPKLADRLARFETQAGVFALVGLSAHLRDLFRLAGCEAWLRSSASAAELAAPATEAVAAAGAERERAS